MLVNVIRTFKNDQYTGAFEQQPTVGSPNIQGKTLTITRFTKKFTNIIYILPERKTTHIYYDNILTFTKKTFTITFTIRKC